MTAKIIPLNQPRKPSPTFMAALEAIAKQHRDFLNGWEWKTLLDELKRRQEAQKEAAK